MTEELKLCPWCGEKLEKGNFRSRGCNYFLPEGMKAPLFNVPKYMEKANAVFLPPYYWKISFNPDFPDAFLCRNCRKIIIPYEEDCF